MTDTIATDPVTPTPPPPTTIAPLKPGYLTSEAWFTFVVSAIGLIPSSGLVANAPIAAQIVGMVIAALQVVNYTANRTSLKQAHLTAGGAPSSATRSLAAKTSSAVVAAALIGAGIFGGTQASCTKTQTAAVSAGGQAFAGCSSVNLYKLVGTTGLTLLETVARDLVSGDYLAAIAALVTTVGEPEVACAALAIDTVVAAGSTSGAAALTPIQAHAAELINKHGWGRYAYPSPTSAPMSTPIDTTLTHGAH